MNLMDQLHDIEGLDAISRWPLALGWWLLIAIAILIAAIVAAFITYKLAAIRSWKYDTLQKLRALENNLSETTAQQSLIILSEYLRRIAVKRFSRKECAGLVGEEWLRWLSSHDPNNFDWSGKGALLIQAPYAPSHCSWSVENIRDLIRASRDWVVV